jgi:hypothetical protein
MTGPPPPRAQPLRIGGVRVLHGADAHRQSARVDVMPPEEPLTGAAGRKVLDVRRQMPKGSAGRTGRRILARPACSRRQRTRAQRGEVVLRVRPRQDRHLQPPVPIDRAVLAYDAIETLRVEVGLPTRMGEQPAEQPALIGLQARRRQVLRFVQRLQKLSNLGSRRHDPRLASAHTPARHDARESARQTSCAVSWTTQPDLSTWSLCFSQPVPCRPKAECRPRHPAPSCALATRG